MSCYLNAVPMFAKLVPSVSNESNFAPFHSQPYLFRLRFWHISLRSVMGKGKFRSVDELRLARSNSKRTSEVNYSIQLDFGVDCELLAKDLTELLSFSM